MVINVSGLLNSVVFLVTNEHYAIRLRLHLTRVHIFNHGM